MDANLEKFSLYLDQELQVRAKNAVKDFCQSLASAYSTVAEAKFVELVNAGHKVEKMQKLVQSEFQKIGRNGKLWGRNIKTLLHKAARDEMDGIILGA